MTRCTPQGRHGPRCELASCEDGCAYVEAAQAQQAREGREYGGPPIQEDAHMTIPSPEELRRLVAEASPGPWTLGCYFDDGKLCTDGTTGTHSISSTVTKEEVCGNYDYEEGGVIEERDARLIVLAPQLALSLASYKEAVGEVKAALESGREATRGHESSCDEGVCAEALLDIEAALSKLEALSAAPTAQQEER